MFERFTDASRKAMTLADQTARNYGQQFVGRETVFLGLTDPDTELYVKLKEHGYDIDNMRKLVEESLKKIPSRGDIGNWPLTKQTTEAKNTVELAIQSARRLGDTEIKPEHLLYGLMVQSKRDKDLLSGLKLSPGKLESELV